MTRLTTKDSIMGRKHDIKCGCASVWKIKLKNYRYELIEDVVDKLGELEDIEEEIGIDLITLFKAFAQGGIYVDVKENNNGISKIEKFEVGGILFDKKDKVWRLTTDDKYDGAYWGSIATNKNYGITWALTKEELL